MRMGGIVMTEEQIEEWKRKIDAMSQEDMARLWRFSPSGHPVFDNSLPIYAYFETKFKGFTPELSKRIGW